MKKLRRKKIRSYAAANEYLETEYLAEYDQRFARAAAAGEDYHRQPAEPDRTGCCIPPGNWAHHRPDWVVRHGNRFFQVKRQSRYAPTKSQVVVCEREDGKLEIRYGGRRLCHEKIGGQPRMAKTLSTNAGPKGDRNMKKRSCGNGGVVEKWKTTSRFPLSHRLLLD